MTQGSNELHFFYDAQNKPAVVVYNGTPYSYVKNLQGDIVAILDSNKNVVVSYVYDAWGRPISKTGSMAATLGTVQPFRYRGYVYDEETELYYLQTRYYSPENVRFLNADIYVSTGRGLLDGNMFAYCIQAPTNQIDPNGTTSFCNADLEMMSNRSLLSPYNLSSIAGGFRGNTTGIRSGYGVWKTTQSYNECWISSPYNVGYSTPAHNQMSSSSVSTASIPLKAYETYYYLREHKFTPKHAYKGGSTYENDGRDGSAILPSAYAPFREYDIDPKVPGQNRNGERIVVGSGSGGGVWYTPDHYRHFLVMEVNFVK